MPFIQFEKQLNNVFSSHLIFICLENKCSKKLTKGRIAEANF